MLPSVTPTSAASPGTAPFPTGLLVSFHNIESPTSIKSSTKSKTRTDERTLKSVARKKRAQKSETFQEEVAYQKKVQWLVDHGESDKDKPVDGQNDTDSTAS
jgi:hypothetical protein